MNKNLENALIAEEMARTNNNLSKVARALGIDYFALKGRYEGQSLLDKNFHPATGPEPVDITVLGRQGFQQYVIAIKRQGGVWPEKYEKVIDEARLRFDAGTHEMYQTPSDGWVVLYSIPRMKPTEPRRFFSSMGSIE